MSESRIVFCPACGAKNRVDQARLAEGLSPVCGRCKQPLKNAPAKPITVTDANFSAQVAQSRLPVLLDLWAPWCGPCRAMAPVLDEVAAAMAGRVLVGKLNVDENPQTASRFQVNSIPTLIIFKEGREIQRLVGGQSKAALIQRLEQLL